MLDYEIEVVCIFRDLEWKILRFNVAVNYNKELFLHKVFNRLSKEEILQLEKLSLCQNCESDVEVLPFINDCKGKLWFDAQDCDNNLIRDEYINLICSNE